MDMLPPPHVPPEMPAYQYPAERVCIENAHRWRWMKAFYEREVSRPDSADETLEQVRQRAAHIRPTPEKLAYLDMELITFPHFGMSTASGHQQGTGKEDPRIFNPVGFDAREWVRFHQAIGARMIVFVAKHHDGYALWPSRLNDYNIRSSPWRDGKGDMVREIAEACREGGLKLGLYISLWDHHDPRCAIRKGPDQVTQEQRQTYQAYIEQQLMETLIPYGEISELWFDGAGTTSVEDWNRIFELIHHYQPRCLVAMCGFGARWCGNESAIGDAVNWNVLPMLPELRQHKWVPFHYEQLISKNLPNLTDDLAFLRGQELFFIPQECDTLVLNGGWHWDGVGEPRSLESLVNVYYASIGQGGVLIISPAPDPNGVFSPRQVERMGEFRRWIDESFGDNLLRGARLSLAGAQAGYSPDHLLRDERDRPCLAADRTTALSLVAEFAEPRTFNNLVAEEFLEPGQRISSFALDVWVKDRWTLVTEGRTVGRKRVLPFADVTGDRIRFRITGARDCPALRYLGLFRARPYREEARAFTDADYRPALPEKENLRPGLRWSYYEDANNGFLPYQEMFSDLETAKVTALASGHDLSPEASAVAVPGGRHCTQHFAMRFDGYVRAPARAVYRFRARANSGCRLFLDDSLLISNDESGGLKDGAKTAEVALLPGLHRLTILYYFGTAGEPKLNLSVEWPGNAGGGGFGWSPGQRLMQLLCCE